MATDSAQQLGRLEQVDLHEAWVSETGHFTPWLAKPENLALLGDAVGIELECEAQEKDVGPFRADILCKDTPGNWVLIENQLERTDHTHLGQLMTYAAGLKAVTIIWVAQKFTDEHRAALDWLNDITGDEFNFFGLEIELWRIGNSAVAPKFNIVVQPNIGTKAAVAPGSLQERQLAFWTGYRDYLAQHGESRLPKPRAQTWVSHSIGTSGFWLTPVASTYSMIKKTYESEIRMEFVIDCDKSKVYFEALQARKGEIEQALGQSLVWYNPPNYRSCRISCCQSADLEDSSKWPEYFAWLARQLESFRRVFKPLIDELVSEEPSPVDTE